MPLVEYIPVVRNIYLVCELSQHGFMIQPFCCRIDGSLNSSRLTFVDS